MKKRNPIIAWVISILLIFSSILLTSAENNKPKILFKKAHTYISKTSYLEKKDISIALNNNKDVHIYENNKKVFFHINTPNSQEIWEIIIKNKNKKIAIAYKTDIQTPEKDLDISKNMIQKHIQNMPLSCEISAAADIISHLKWKNTPEKDLLVILDKSSFNKPHEKKDNMIVWGNPEEWFVGNIDYYGKNKVKPYQRLMTGYGVYEKPIVKVFQKYGLHAQSFNKNDFTQTFTQKQLLEKTLRRLNNGSMIQYWWDYCTDPDFEDGILDTKELIIEQTKQWYNSKNACSTFGRDRRMTWYYKDSDGSYKKHIGFSGEHVFYLLWYIGTPENPESIIVWDTATGKHTYPIKEWMRKWSMLDYRTIIVDN